MPRLKLTELATRSTYPVTVTLYSDGNEARVTVRDAESERGTFSLTCPFSDGFETFHHPYLLAPLSVTAKRVPMSPEGIAWLESQGEEVEQDDEAVAA